MTYATPGDMVTLFGGREMVGISRPDTVRVQVADDLLVAIIQEEDVSAWSDAEVVAGQMCVARIQQALSQAGRLMDSYLGRRYALPIGAEIVEASPLVSVCADIARYTLQDDRSPKQATERYEAALQWLRDVGAGRCQLPTVAHDTGGPLVGVVVEYIPGRKFF